MKSIALLLSFIITGATLFAQVPQQINYQGRVTVQGVNFIGTGQFKFALVGPGQNTSTQATSMPVIGDLGDGMGPRVLSITVLNGGSGYITAPAVTITHPTGSGATATAVLTDGVVTSIVVDTNGLGYEYPPTNTLVTIAAPPENLQRPTHWSNDNTSIMGAEPTDAVELQVSAGLYSVTLGDTNLPNMAMFPGNLFVNHGDLFLRVWFNDGTNGFQLLAPDQRLGTAPYAFRATLAENVPPNSITGAQLADGAVGAAKIAESAVDSTKLAPGAISPSALNTGASAPAPGQVLSFTNDGLRWVNGGGGSNFPFNDSFSSPASILGLSNDNGDGIYGQTGAITKSGVFGRNDVSLTIFGQPAGQGVYGFGSSKAIGVKGLSVSNDGVVGETLSAGKSGVFGTSGSGNGVAGFSEGAGNSGVFGFTGNAATYGGSFLNSHPNGIALKAFGKAEIDGALSVHTLTITGGADLAEPFAMSHGNVEPGSVVIIDELNPGKLRVSHNAYDKKVAGIVSGADGIRPGISMIQEDMLEAGENVALSGRVYVKANNSAGDIQPGDLLTTSAIPGEAMKASDHDRAQGAILGKAMTSLSESSGKVLVLVTLQ